MLRFAVAFFGVRRPDGAVGNGALAPAGETGLQVVCCLGVKPPKETAVPGHRTPKTPWKLTGLPSEFPENRALRVRLLPLAVFGPGLPLNKYGIRGTLELPGLLG